MSLAAVSDLQGYLGNVTANTAELQRLLDMASAVAEKYVGRSFASATYTERRNGWGWGTAGGFDFGYGTGGVVTNYGRGYGIGADALRLRQYPITAVTSLSIDATVIAAGDGITTGYWFEGDTLYLLGGLVYTRGRKNIVVTYTAGFNPIPADVVHAVIEIAAQAFREKDWVGFQSKSLAGETVSFLRGAMPDSAKATLMLYRPVGYAGD